MWFFSWKIHDIRLTWPGTAWLSSGNELCSSFSEEVRPCQALPWLLQGMYYTVHSLKKSGRAMNFSGNEPHCSFPKISQAWVKILEKKWSCQLYRTTSHTHVPSLPLLVVFNSFVFWLMSSKDSACGLSLWTCLHESFWLSSQNSFSISESWRSFRRLRMTGSGQLWECLWLLARSVPQCVCRRIKWFDMVCGTFVSGN